MENIDLRQMRLFVAAYEEGSFSQAAQREHCTQPGLSLQMSQLETALAQQLFHRTARGVTPTVAGQQFYAACVEVLESFKSAKQKMLDLSGNPAGAIRIALPPALCKGALSWMLPEYMRTHPFINVGIQEGIVSNLLSERLLSGELEAAVFTAIPEHLGLKTTHFFTDRLVLVTTQRRVRGRKRPVRMGEPVPVRELAKMKLVLPSQHHSLRQIVDRVARLADGGSGQIVEMDGVLGKLDLVRNTDWATVLPSIAVADDLGRGILHVQPITQPDLWLEYYLVHPTRSILSAACRDFLQQLKTALQRNRPAAPAP